AAALSPPARCRGARAPAHRRAAGRGGRVRRAAPRTLLRLRPGRVQPPGAVPHLLLPARLVERRAAAAGPRVPRARPGRGRAAVRAHRELSAARRPADRDPSISTGVRNTGPTWLDDSEPDLLCFAGSCLSHT